VSVFARLSVRGFEIVAHGVGSDRPRKVLTRIVRSWWSFFTLPVGGVDYSICLALRFLFGVCGEAGHGIRRWRFPRWIPVIARARAQGSLSFAAAHLTGGLTPIWWLRCCRTCLAIHFLWACGAFGSCGPPRGSAGFRDTSVNILRLMLRRGRLSERARNPPVIIGGKDVWARWRNRRVSVPSAWRTFPNSYGSFSHDVSADVLSEQRGLQDAVAHCFSIPLLLIVFGDIAAGRLTIS